MVLVEFDIIWYLKVIYDKKCNYNYNKILKSDWPSTVLISALIGQFNRIVRAITRALKCFFFFHCWPKKDWNFQCFDLEKEPYISQVLLKLWLIFNRTSCGPIWSVIMLMIKQIKLPQLGPPILLSTRMITDRIGLHSVVLPLLIVAVMIPSC